MSTSALAATALLAGARFSQRLPGPTYESPTEGSPGFAGFVATFVLALAIIALGVSFTRRMRRSSHRERMRADAAAQDAAAQDAGAAGHVAGSSTAADAAPARDVDDPPSAGPRA